MHYLADSGPSGLEFRPKTPTEFFSLQLARRMSDVRNLQRYIELTEHYRDDQILRAVRGLGKRPGQCGIEVLEGELQRISNRTSYGE
jgi:hypothetical protein